MKAIVEKELRAFAVPVLAMVALLALAKAVALLRHPDLVESCAPGAAWLTFFVAMAMGPIPLFGKEGDGKTAVLLCTLPVSRARIWAVKTGVYFATLFALALVLWPLGSPHALLSFSPLHEELPNIAVGVWYSAATLLAITCAMLSAGGPFVGLIAGSMVLPLIGIPLGEFFAFAALACGVAMLAAARRTFLFGDPSDGWSRTKVSFRALLLAIPAVFACHLAYTHVVLRFPSSGAIETVAATRAGALVEVRARDPLRMHSADGMLRLLADPRGLAPALARLDGTRGEIVSTSPSGDRLVVRLHRNALGFASSRGTMVLCDGASGVTEIGTFYNAGDSIAWSPDESAIAFDTSFEAQSLRIFSPGQPLVVVRHERSYASGSCFSPDGTQLWSLVRGQVVACDRRTGAPVALPRGAELMPWRDAPYGNSSYVDALRVSPASRSILLSVRVYADRSYTSLYRWAEGATSWTLLLDNLDAWTVGGPGAARVIATRGAGGPARELVSLDLTAGTTAKRAEPSGSRPDLAVSPDGRHVSIAESDGTARVPYPGRRQPAMRDRVRVLDAVTLAPVDRASWTFPEGHRVAWASDGTLIAHTIRASSAASAERLHLTGERVPLISPDSARTAAAGCP